MSTDQVRKIREIKDDEDPFLVNTASISSGFLLIPKQMAGILTHNHINQALLQNKPRLWENLITYFPAIPLALITTDHDISASDAVTAVENNEKYKDHSIALDIMKVSPDGGKTLFDAYVGFTFKSAIKEVVIAGKDRIIPRDLISNAMHDKKTIENEVSVSETGRKWWKFWEAHEKPLEKSSKETLDLSKPQHRFEKGVCTICGLSEIAVEKFGWECKNK